MERLEMVVMDGLRRIRRRYKWRVIGRVTCAPIDMSRLAN